ncbi:MAG: hypothetical protein PHG65_07810, partial [Kiritimatiellae bacterium]|nr:hypothetical protein [Kiritimatiellia bacterium]
MASRMDNDPRLLLITLWVQPRRIAQVLVCTVALLLPRLLFYSAQPLPFYLPFNPGGPLMPIGGILFGPAGAWGALLASLLADWMVNMDTALSPFRAIGCFFFAFSAHLLWSRLTPRPGAPCARTSLAMRLCLAALPGCLLTAAWAGFGSELLRLYPFPYIATLFLLQNLIFVPLLGIPLFVWLFRHPHVGRPIRRMETEYPTGWRFTKRGALGLTVGAAGAIAFGMLISNSVYRIGPFSAFVVGVTDCPWVTAAVAPFLLLQ